MLLILVLPPPPPPPRLGTGTGMGTDTGMGTGTGTDTVTSAATVSTRPLSERPGPPGARGPAQAHRCAGARDRLVGPGSSLRHGRTFRRAAGCGGRAARNCFKAL